MLHQRNMCKRLVLLEKHLMPQIFTETKLKTHLEFIKRERWEVHGPLAGTQVRKNLFSWSANEKWSNINYEIISPFKFGRFFLLVSASSVFVDQMIVGLRRLRWIHQAEVGVVIFFLYLWWMSKRTLNHHEAVVVVRIWSASTWWSNFESLSSWALHRFLINCNSSSNWASARHQFELFHPSQIKLLHPHPESHYVTSKAMISTFSPLYGSIVLLINSPKPFERTLNRAG